MSMQRIALEATLVTPNGALRVVTTHLEYFSATQPMAQVGRLRALPHEASAACAQRATGHGGKRAIPDGAAACALPARRGIQFFAGFK